LVQITSIISEIRNIVLDVPRHRHTHVASDFGTQTIFLHGSTPCHVWSLSFRTTCSMDSGKTLL